MNICLLTDVHVKEDSDRQNAGFYDNKLNIFQLRTVCQGQKSFVVTLGFQLEQLIEKIIVRLIYNENNQLQV